MTAWTYYGPTGAPVKITFVGWGELERMGQPTETVGPRALELLLRARSTTSGTLVLRHDREHNAERMAARRLCERGLLHWPNAMGGQIAGASSWLYFYALTERGRTAWLRSKA